MNSIQRERGSLGEAGMSTPQAIVNIASVQPSNSSNSSESATPTPVSDVKLFLFNKPDSDLKAPTTKSHTNGVSPKVMLPGSANATSGFAYLGTLIKQGRDTGEGQKVLLTPVIKDGGRFILPRPALPQRSVPTSTTVTSPVTDRGSIYIPSTQQQRRSFLIHNPNLNGKDLVSMSLENSGTVLPKVLPPPKVPLVVCSSRPHDVTLTSFKPLAPKDDSSRHTLDVNSLKPFTSKETTSDVSALLPGQSDSNEFTITSIRDVLSSQSTSQPTTSDKTDADDVVVVGDCEMPRPIVRKASIKSVETALSSTTPQSITVHRVSSNVDTTDSSVPTKSNVAVTESHQSDCKNNSKTLVEPDSTSKEIVVQTIKTENTESSSVSVDGKNSSETSDNVSVKCISVSNEPAAIPDPNVVLLKSKNNVSGIQVTGSNGHIVRILSTNENKDTGTPPSTVYFKDGKAVIFGNLAKEFSNLKEQQAKEIKEKEDCCEGKESNNNKEVSSESCSEQVKDQLITTPSKHVQKMFTNKTSPPTICLETSPKLVTNTGSQIKITPANLGGSSQLHIKELSKDGALLERSRKRKGAPLLRDCFKKTIAVKRLEPLQGAGALDPLQVIEWDLGTGVGTLPGSTIKFILNAYGALQVYEGDGKVSSNPKPVGGMDVVYANDVGKDDIALCIECECYGLLIEFIDERFCTSICKERFDVRRALITKRSLCNTKETNKKRKLFEIALNKTSTKPEEEQEYKTLIKLKSIKPKLIETKPADIKASPESKVTTSPKPESKVLESKPEVKNIVPIKTISELTSTSELRILPILKSTADSSTSTDSSCVAPKPDLSMSLVKLNKQTDSSKAPVVTKIESPSEPPKQESKKPQIVEFPIVTVAADDKKPIKERLQTQRVDASVSTSLTPALDTGMDKKVKVELDWGEYLTQTRSHPAWVRLFKDAFPALPNLFKVNYKLEAIDPQRPSLFCAVSVSRIKGYRLKLHFDGFPKMHDFWVNADSPNIFPCGFCSSHGIELEPPHGFHKNTFNWAKYLSQMKAKPAPPKCFIHKQVDSGEPNLFKVGMKLEAVDKKNSCLVCVATVAAVLDHRILIHFDSWDDSYDYWAEYYSPHIHPVGWCQRNKYILTPPNGHKKKNFSWRRYLTETESEAAPETAFMMRPSIRFKKGTKLEAVDHRSPHLLRVATIKQVLPYQVHVVFDGFPDHFGHWFDDDSSDLHPINWGARTGHPLTPPPKHSTLKKCGTAGCMGDGNVSSGDFETHSSLIDCPYSMDNLEEETLLPDRLLYRRAPPKPMSIGKNREQTSSDSGREETVTLRNRKSRDTVEPTVTAEIPRPVTPNTVMPVAASVAITVSAAAEETSMFSSTVSANSANSTQISSKLTPINSPKDSPKTPSPVPPVCSPPFSIKSIEELQTKPEDVAKDAELTAACDKFLSKSLSTINCSSEIKPHYILEWDSRKVTSFIESILQRTTLAFYNNKVDGESFLMLTEEELIKKLSFSKLESTIIYSNIVMLRNKFS